MTDARCAADGTATGFRVPPDVVTRLVGGTLLILQISSARFFELCPAGASIWSGIVAGRSLAETARHLAGLFGIKAEDVEQDLSDFVTDLSTAGLLAPRTDEFSGAATTAGFDLPALRGYSKPRLLCLGHIREFTEQPLRCDQ